LDFVINYKAFIKGAIEEVKQQVIVCTKLGLDHHKIVKWIIEVAALDAHHIVQLTALIKNTIISNFSEKLQNFNKNQLEKFHSLNKRTFQSLIIKDHSLGDIPLNYIYKNLFNPDLTCEELGRNKNFYISFLESRQDHNISLKKTEEDSWSEKIPNYIKNEDDFIYKLFSQQENLENFIKRDLKESVSFSQIEFKYNYTHPILKKKFMGPSKLEVEDCFKVYFISPKCLIVEVFSYLSGFMMMDTFYSILQYKFDSSFDYSTEESRLKFNTKVTISFGIEFIKDSWFKTKILNEALADMDESVKNSMMPFITKVMDSQKEVHAKNYKVFLLNSIKNEFIESSQIRGEYEIIEEIKNEKDVNENENNILLIEDKFRVKDLMIRLPIG
jgi:hypothetical protein